MDQFYRNQISLSSAAVNHQTRGTGSFERERNVVCLCGNTIETKIVRDVTCSFHVHFNGRSLREQSVDEEPKNTNQEPPTRSHVCLRRQIHERCPAPKLTLARLYNILLSRLYLFEKRNTFANEQENSANKREIGLCNTKGQFQWQTTGSFDMYWLLTKNGVKMTGYWPSSYFCVFLNRDGVEVHKLMANIQPPSSPNKLGQLRFYYMAYGENFFTGYSV